MSNVSLSELVSDIKQIVEYLEAQFDLSKVSQIEKINLACKMQQTELLTDISDQLEDFLNAGQEE